MARVMTAFLPPYLLSLFAPRPPLQHLPALELDSRPRKVPRYAGLADFIGEFDPHAKPAAEPVYTWTEMHEKRIKEKKAAAKEKFARLKATWDPHSDEANKTADPYKTIFVSRLPLDTTEDDLKPHFERFGEVRKLRIVRNRKGVSRGYAFLEYAEEQQMRDAYKYADGLVVGGQRVIIDYERGRTLKEWRPRKCGGGLGGEQRKEGYVKPKPIQPRPESTSQAPPQHHQQQQYQPQASDHYDRRRDDSRGSRGGRGDSGEYRDRDYSHRDRDYSRRY